MQFLFESIQPIPDFCLNHIAPEWQYVEAIKTIFPGPKHSHFDIRFPNEQTHLLRGICTWQILQSLSISSPSLLKKYIDYVEKYYHASLEPVDFVNAADESRKKINSWVESQTNGRVCMGFSPKSTLLDYQLWQKSWVWGFIDTGWMNFGRS